MIVAIIIVISSIFFFFIRNYRVITRLRKIRDNFDITTPEGRYLIRAYNQRINKLNGFYVFKRRTD